MQVGDKLWIKDIETGFIYYSEIIAISIDYTYTYVNTQNVIETSYILNPIIGDIHRMYNYCFTEQEYNDGLAISDSEKFPLNVKFSLSFEEICSIKAWNQV